MNFFQEVVLKFATMAMLRISPLAQCFVHRASRSVKMIRRALFQPDTRASGVFSVTSTSLRYWLYQIMSVEQVELPFAEVRYGNADVNTIRKTRCVKQPVHVRLPFSTQFRY